MIFIPIIFIFFNARSLYRVYRGNNAKDKIALEIISTLFLLFISSIFVELVGLLWNDWYVQLYNNEIHTFIHTQYQDILLLIFIISFISYILIRIGDEDSMPPVIMGLLFASLYLGFIATLMSTIQILPVPSLMLVGLNTMIVYFKTILIYIRKHTQKITPTNIDTNVSLWRKYLMTTRYAPMLGFLILLPLTVIVVIGSILFGQEPSNLLKAWTDTADWTLSMRTPPENLFADQHYLCSVAAGGHRSVVKPLRVGIRHGNRIVVNRQLCVANAFEQLVQERLPALHKLIRSTYDTLGYPVAKHIKTKGAANFVYYLMKPLEWLFIIVLYTFDSKPEDRIAVQYPHAPLPS